MSAPKKGTFWLGFILGLLGILASSTLNILNVPFITAYSFWFMTIGFAILSIGCLFKGL